ncbi:hypothetical protein [Roseicyclus mahoneyensis]|uniref:Type IV pilus biogenesis protein PilP n=1 Tax=Roseicyclus mahoneyensis TaxID=164332 RepID=A0A316GHD9_9RHOB|nr:hypothetical protein [Roseicyclus mahoneyensis]PWK60476.1 hypothetical protein C7455_104112 [Roseicyclus mahoneyensis]
MTVEFALFVSPEGIALAHRQPKGHWALVAEARLDTDDLEAAMAGLKSTAADRGGAEAPVLLVLPDDQVLYTSFLAPADDADLVADRIVEGLDGMTPYAVADLVYDWRKVEEDRIKVAVVARETLGEATEFVAAHGFKPVGFAAMPPAERFPGMPLFGPESSALGLDRGGLAFGGDDWIAPAPETSEMPATPAKTEAEDVTELQPPAEHLHAEPADAPTSDMAPEPPPPVPVDLFEAAGNPAEAVVATAEVVQQPDDAASDPKTVEADGPAGFDAPVAISDPTLEQPVAPLSDADRPWPEQETSLEEPPETIWPWDFDPEPSGDLTPQTPEAAPAPNPVDDLPDDIPPMPTATRGRVAGPSTRPLTASKPEEVAGRGIDPTAGLSATELRGDGTETDSPDDATPTLGFAARRGKAPKATSGDIVSTRQSRLGFGTPSDATGGPVLHPDAAPVRPAPATTPARPGTLLAAQLARVRDASKTKPQPAVAPPPRGGTALDPLTEGPTRAEPESTASAVPAKDAQTAGRGGYGFARRRKSEAAPAPSTGSVASGQNAFASGLLARKPAEASGPSFRMGLILTLVLLVLLALIAIWSAMFLPDSPIARLFSSGSNSEASQRADSPAPPLAISAPPTIGALDPESAVSEAVSDAPIIDSETAVLPVPETDGPETDETSPEQIAQAPLPDIDAELDLPPLPPLPEELLPSLEETERIYAEDGIWPRPPDLPVLGALSSANDIYVASIDPEVPITDAIALSDPQLDPSEVLRRVPPPPPFGATPDRTALGLIAPTPEGVLTPEGAFVVLGRPPVAAIPRPREIAPAVEAVPQEDVEDAVLGTFQPSPRPADLDETRERQVLGGFSATELAGLRPDPRPVSAQEAAAQASLFPQAATDAAPATEPEPEIETETAAPAAVIEATPLAVAASRLPAARPANIDALVAAAAETPGPAVATEAIARAPSIPSSADVTRAATERNAIRLRDVNLIGVTGTPNDRRALVRLPSGRFVRVGVGDRLDGGRVAAIGETSLQYVRNGRNVTLEIPG